MFNSKQAKKSSIMIIIAAALLSSNSASAVPVSGVSENENFQDSATASWGGWTRGDAETSFIHWSVIGDTDGLTTDTSPDVDSLGVSSASLVANNAGAFVTGGGAGGNIYSFSDTPDFSVDLTTTYAAPTDLVTVALQIKILGTDLDFSTVVLGGLAYDSTETLFSGTAGGPFGGDSKEYLFVWNDVTAGTDYSLDFLALGSSMSLDEVSVDIGVSAVPVPAAVWMFLSAISGLAVVRRKV